MPSILHSVNAAIVPSSGALRNGSEAKRRRRIVAASTRMPPRAFLGQIAALAWPAASMRGALPGQRTGGIVSPHLQLCRPICEVRCADCAWVAQLSVARSGRLPGGARSPAERELVAGAPRRDGHRHVGNDILGAAHVERRPTARENARVMRQVTPLVSRKATSMLRSVTDADQEVLQPRAP